MPIRCDRRAKGMNDVTVSQSLLMSTGNGLDIVEPGWLKPAQVSAGQTRGGLGRRAVA